MINSGMNVMLIATKVLMDIFLSQFLKFSEIWTSRCQYQHKVLTREKSKHEFKFDKNCLKA